MAELKTKENDADVASFIRGIADDGKRADAQTLVELMTRVTECAPKMWGAVIVGFGHFSYTYASGHSGEWFVVGFSPRKQNLTLYIMDGFDEYESLLAKLGKHTTGKSCLYVKRLSDVDLGVLEQLVSRSVATTRERG
mgnify:CR=1 FL=1